MSTLPEVFYATEGDRVVLSTGCQGGGACGFCHLKSANCTLAYLVKDLYLFRYVATA